MSVRTMVGFPGYGLNEQGEAVSLRKSGEWLPLKCTKRICLYGEYRTTVSLQKFKFCVEKGISPKSLSAGKIVITKDGEMVTKQVFQGILNKNRSLRRKALPLGERVLRLQKTIEYAECCLDYMTGKDSSRILYLFESEREMLKNTLHCNEMLADTIVATAELELLEALNTGNVTDPRRWLYKRARGILLETKSKVVKIKDYGRY